MKRKAIHASLRKESQTFDGWLKYEVVIQNEDGTEETVPAYGKDLQDALSRVVHDERVEKLEKRTKRIPDIIWVLLWFGYVLGLVQLTFSHGGGYFDGLFFLGGMVILTTTVIATKNFFRLRNISK